MSFPKEIYRSNGNFMEDELSELDGLVEDDGLVARYELVEIGTYTGAKFTPVVVPKSE